MRKVAVMGLWHVHAEEYYKSAVCAECEVVGAYDDDKGRLDTFCEKYGVRAFASFDELLASDADGVIVGNATCDHADTIIRIADSG